MLHKTLLPESIFYVALASPVQSYPQISPHLTKSSSHFLCLDCVCVHVRQEGGKKKKKKKEGGKKGLKGRREKCWLTVMFHLGVRSGHYDLFSFSIYFLYKCAN